MKTEQLHLFRNRALIARYYYWNDIWQKRHEAVIEELSTREFFICELTIMRELAKPAQDQYLSELRRNCVTIKALAAIYPGFNWTENMNVKSKKQLALTL